MCLSLVRYYIIYLKYLSNKMIESWQFPSFNSDKTLCSIALCHERTNLILFEMTPGRLELTIPALKARCTCLYTKAPEATMQGIEPWFLERQSSVISRYTTQPYWKCKTRTSPLHPKCSVLPLHHIPIKKQLFTLRSSCRTVYFISTIISGDDGQGVIRHPCRTSHNFTSHSTTPVYSRNFG